MAIIPEARDGKAARQRQRLHPALPQPQDKKRRNFIRGYSFDFSIGRRPTQKYFGAWGEELQKAIESVRGAASPPRPWAKFCRVMRTTSRINKNVVDTWGIPVLNFQCKYTDNEFNMAKDAMNTLDEVCRSAGWEILHKNDKMFPPGYSIHELGTCRMGDNPRPACSTSGTRATT